MRISISGASGFTGSYLVRELVKQGHEVVKMNRDSFSMPLEEFTRMKIEGSDAVINLAGAPIIRRWTEPWKEEIRNSRILTTRKIAEAIRLATAKPMVLISASAVGIYDSINSHTEESLNFGTGFLADVCKEWESEAEAVKDICRVTVLRQGIVIGKGGMLGKVRTPFSIGLGAKIGNGKQALSFIHIDDLAGIVGMILKNPETSGVYNAVAPWPTTNIHFTEVLGKVLNQPALLAVPKFVLKLIYGEGAQTLTEGQKVLPDRLMKLNFPFKYPTIEKALMKVYR